MTGFVVHGHKYFEIYMLCIWFLNKCPSMEKVTTLTSKGQEGHASQPHIDSDLQSQSNQTSFIFNHQSSTLCKWAATGHNNVQWERKQ